MKKVFSVVLLTLMAVAGQAKEKIVVWENPTTEFGTSYRDGFFELSLDVYLYLANGSPEEGWMNVIKEYEVLGDNVVHYNLPQDQQAAVEHFIGISGYPTYKLIDGDGNILDVNADPRHDLDGLARMLDRMNVRKN